MAFKRDRLYKQLQRLSLEEKQALREWLDGQIAEDQAPPEVNPQQGREVAESKQVGRVTYQAELIKCGKSNSGVRPRESSTGLIGTAIGSRGKSLRAGMWVRR